jgi:hypothetical protein
MLPYQLVYFRDDLSRPHSDASEWFNDFLRELRDNEMHSPAWDQHWKTIVDSLYEDLTARIGWKTDHGLDDAYLSLVATSRAKSPYIEDDVPSRLYEHGSTGQ